MSCLGSSNINHIQLLRYNIVVFWCTACCAKNSMVLKTHHMFNVLTASSYCAKILDFHLNDTHTQCILLFRENRLKLRKNVLLMHVRMCKHVCVFCREKNCILLHSSLQKKNLIKGRKNEQNLCYYDSLDLGESNIIFNFVSQCNNLIIAW